MSSRAAGATPSRASSTSATPPSHCRSTSPSSSPAIPSTGTSCRPTPPSGCGSAHPDEHAHHPRIHASYQKEETMTSLRKIAALASAGALTVGLLSACTGSSDSQSSPNGSASSKQVTITVAGLLPTADDAAKQQLADRVASFEAKYPNIKVEPQDYEWLPPTLHHAARRWHAAERLRDPADRRQDPDREQAAGRHRQVRQGAAVRRRLQ